LSTVEVFSFSIGKESNFAQFVH